MSYTTIAQEEITVRGLTSPGSKHTYTFVIQERFADEPATIPEIGIIGQPMFIVGSSGNDMFYPFAPIQIQFSIRDKEGFYSKFSGRSKRDFKLQVREQQPVGYILRYELFLYLPSSNTEYFEARPKLDLVATNGLGLLKGEYFTTVPDYIELEDFLTEAVQRLALGVIIEVYSLWDSGDNESMFPIGYRLKKNFLARFYEGNNRISYWDVLENFCEQFNLQLYQEETKWIFLERKIRINAPDTVTGVIFGPGIAEPVLTTRSLRSILDADKVERRPKAQFKPGLKEIKTTFKVGDIDFKNPDFSQNRIKRQIPGWSISALDLGEFDTAGYGSREGERHLFLNILNEDVDFGFCEQESGHVYAPGDSLKVSFDYEVGMVSNQKGAIQYFEATFRDLEGNKYVLNRGNYTWNTFGTEPPDSPNYSFEFLDGDVDTGDNTITEADHGLIDGDCVFLTSSGSLPAPLSEDTKYFILESTANTFKLSATPFGTAIDITDVGSGTRKVIQSGAFIASVNSFEAFSDVIGSEEIVITPPAGKTGYITLSFRFKDYLENYNLDGQTFILKLNIESTTQQNRQQKSFINSRGIRNPDVRSKTFGIGDVDEFGDLFTYEYYDGAAWEKAQFISNTGESKSVFELAPYDLMCQANKDQIEHSQLITRKYLYPDWLKTIILERSDEKDLFTIPLEYKWNMVTGHVEIYSAEAFLEKLAITRLKYYEEEEYEALDPLTVITDEGDVLEGFTMGANSSDGRGFALEFDDLEHTVTEGSATIQVAGVNYEIDTLILE